MDAVSVDAVDAVSVDAVDAVSVDAVSVDAVSMDAVSVTVLVTTLETREYTSCSTLASTPPLNICCSGAGWSTSFAMYENVWNVRT